MAVIESILLIKCGSKYQLHIIDAIFKNTSNQDQYYITYNIKNNIGNLKETHGALTIDKKYYIYYVNNCIGCIAVIKDSISIDELKNINIHLEELHKQFMKDVGSQWNSIPSDFTTHYMPLHEFLDKPVKPITPMVILEKTVEATKEAVKETLLSILERGEKLSELSNKSDILVMNSKSFYKKSRIMRKNYYIIAVFIIVIIFCIYEINLILRDSPIENRNDYS